KPKRTMDMLRRTKMISSFTEFTPMLANKKDILKVHGPSYVERIELLSKSGGMLSFDTPAPKGIDIFSRRAAGGTLVCGSKLFENYSVMVNPLGGFHHASMNHSSGFCFYNDIAIVIEYLRTYYTLKKFFIIDLDVHHGNGTMDIYYRDPTVLNLSFHQDGETLYPGTGSLEKIGGGNAEGFTVNLPLPPHTGSDAYLSAFDRIIPSLIHQFTPEIIIYQAGVDTHHTDPLADLQLSVQTYYRLAKAIHKLSQRYSQKLLVLLGGGYNSDDCILAYENIFHGLLFHEDYIIEDDPYHSNNIDIVESRIIDLETVLKPYWNFS
ncbi:MAG: histone deacetylase, partial [Candidatus Thermoplasmatota archaeon]|nr:histone deacetylase [Candidatus Thermoplasmatota archaeon]